MTAGIHEWENSKKPSQHEKPFRVEKRSWQDLNLSKFKMAETVVERRDRVELGELW